MDGHWEMMSRQSQNNNLFRRYLQEKYIYAAKMNNVEVSLNDAL